MWLDSAYSCERAFSTSGRHQNQTSIFRFDDGTTLSKILYNVSDEELRVKYQQISCGDAL